MREFVGRSAELAALCGELDAVRDGATRIAVVVGEAGLGKTALLERFLAVAEGVSVVRASGDESETELELGVVDQLLRRAGAAPVSRSDHVGAGVALLDALGELEARGPVLVVVDDAHWADEPSLRAALFAARRLVSDRILLVLATRDDGLLPAGLRAGAVIRLGPLSAEELCVLGSQLGVELSARAAAQLHAHTDGSPLYATALLEELPADRWDEGIDAWPAPRSFAALMRARAAACGEDGQRLIEAVAVLGRSTGVAEAAALAELDDPLDAIEAATAAGLLRYERHALTFSHPLGRAAVYHGLGAGARARLHARAAGVLDGAAALRHRVAGTLGTDAALAADLERFAAGERSRAAWSAVTSALVEASRLSPARADRERRLLDAVEAALYAGDAPRARRLAARIEDFPPSPARDSVLAYAAIESGRGAEAETLLDSAWAQSEAARHAAATNGATTPPPDAPAAACGANPPSRDATTGERGATTPGNAADRGTTSSPASFSPRLAATIAQRRAYLESLRGRAAATVEWGERASALAADDVDVALSTWSLVLALDALGRTGEAHRVLDAGIARLSPAMRAGGMPLADIRGVLLLMADRHVEARAQLAHAAPLVARHGSLVVAAVTHAWLTRAEFALGAWDDAAVHAERAVAFAVEADDARAQLVARSVALLVPTARGHLAEADEHARAAAALPTPFEVQQANARYAAALHAAAHGRPEVVRAALEPLAATADDDRPPPTAHRTPPPPAHAAHDDRPTPATHRTPPPPAHAAHDDRPTRATHGTSSSIALAAEGRSLGDGLDDPGARPWPALYADALVDLGALDAARAFLDAHEPRVAARARPSAAASLARVRGRLGDARGFQRALELIAPLAMPYERARIEVAYGQHLRREGQRRAASERLGAAKERLERLGAVPLLERCERELEACGLTPARRKEPPPRDWLTPRERIVARLAARGLSNREIAAELMLSVKTVERHLSNVFAKRGIHSRAELTEE